MSNKRQAETDEQAALAREKHRLAMSNKCQAKTHLQAALAREKQRFAKRRKQQPGSEKQDGDMEHVINQSMKELRNSYIEQKILKTFSNIGL